MKNYSFKELLATALIVSFLTAFIIGSFSNVKSANASIFDFFGKIPFLNKLFNTAGKTITGTPEKINLSPLNEAYNPAGYEAQVINAVKVSSAAVVAITISKNVPVIERCSYNPFSNLPPEFQQFFGGDTQFYQPCQKGTKLQEVGGGSGFLISADGVILTNRHVVDDTQAQYTVFTNDGKKYPAKILARDAVIDVAIIKIDASNLPTVRLGNSDSTQIGQTAIAIGNALGEFRNTVSVGVVSGLSRNITASGAGISETIFDVIQTDASINPGNSGGPLLNLKGEVIGINTAMVSGAQSIGFAIPVNQVKRIISDVLNFGKIKTPFLGVRYVAVTPAIKELKKLPFDYGALVVKGDNGELPVALNSPADKIGLKEGDIILEFGGQKIDLDHPLISRINLYSVGNVVKLKIWRNSQIIEKEITLSERPQ